MELMSILDFLQITTVENHYYVKSTLAFTLQILAVRLVVHLSLCVEALNLTKCVTDDRMNLLPKAW